MKIFYTIRLLTKVEYCKREYTIRSNNPKEEKRRQKFSLPVVH